MMRAQFIGKCGWLCHKLAIEWLSKIGVNFHGERDERIKE